MILSESHFLLGVSQCNASGASALKQKREPLVDSLSAVRTGLEPATPCVTGMYSNQLNYRTRMLERLSIEGAKIQFFSLLPNFFLPGSAFFFSTSNRTPLPTHLTAILTLTLTLSKHLTPNPSPQGEGS